MIVKNNSEEAQKKRAEASFKKEERDRDGAKAMLEYQVEGHAVRDKTARLKALRLAKEAGAQTNEAPAKQTKRRTETRRDK
jgi:hypothetical protein